jgi:hypothetical protein
MIGDERRRPEMAHVTDLQASRPDVLGTVFLRVRSGRSAASVLAFSHGRRRTL